MLGASITPAGPARPAERGWASRQTGAGAGPTSADTQTRGCSTLSSWRGEGPGRCVQGCRLPGEQACGSLEWPGAARSEAWAQTQSCWAPDRQMAWGDRGAWARGPGRGCWPPFKSHCLPRARGRSPAATSLPCDPCVPVVWAVPWLHPTHRAGGSAGTSLSEGPLGLLRVGWGARCRRLWKQAALTAEEPPCPKVFLGRNQPGRGLSRRTGSCRGQ